MSSVPKESLYFPPLDLSASSSISSSVRPAVINAKVDDDLDLSNPFLSTYKVSYRDITQTVQMDDDPKYTRQITLGKRNVDLSKYPSANSRKNLQRSSAGQPNNSQNPYISTYNASFQDNSSTTQQDNDSRFTHRQSSSVGSELGSDTSHQLKPSYVDYVFDNQKFIEEDKTKKNTVRHSYSGKPSDNSSSNPDMYKTTYQATFQDTFSNIQADCSPRYYLRQNLPSDQGNCPTKIDYYKPLGGTSQANSLHQQYQSHFSKSSKVISDDFNPYQTTYQNSFQDTTPYIEADRTRMCTTRYTNGLY